MFVTKDKKTIIIQLTDDELKDHCKSSSPNHSLSVEITVSRDCLKMTLPVARLILTALQAELMLSRNMILQYQALKVPEDFKLF